jgi:redox-sensitive bicupin YhaK (pirin superfamily)
MLWSEDIPTIAPAVGVSVDVIAGRIEDAAPPSPPPDSWGSHPNGELAIWLIRLAPGAEWTLPRAPGDVNRMLHCFLGEETTVAGTRITKDTGVRLRPDADVTVRSTSGPVEFLLLQGRPIGAPVFQMGPFVMNSPEELRQAVADYRATQFGPWPWGRPDPVHARTEGRFALHADGKVEHREMQSAAG